MKKTGCILHLPLTKKANNRPSVLGDYQPFLAILTCPYHVFSCFESRGNLGKIGEISGKIIKISLKKNWGKSTKGLSSNLIAINSFKEKGILDSYRIASFLVRDSNVFDYGEDSQIKGYSYFYRKLIDWCIEKINTQNDTGPQENILSCREYPEMELYLQNSMDTLWSMICSLDSRS